MYRRTKISICLVLMTLAVAVTFRSSAQEQGAPAATNGTSRKQLPWPDQPFGGVIQERLRTRNHGGRRVSMRVG